MIFGNAVKKSKLISIYIFILIADLLLFPKFLFSTPSFIFLMPLVFLINNKIRILPTILYLALISILLASVFNGLVDNPIHFSENIKRIIQFLFLFFILLFDYKALDYELIFNWLRRFFSVYYAVVLFFLILFFYDYSRYSYLIKVIYPEALPMLLVNFENQRFSFHFTDPNAMGYLIVMVLAFQLVLVSSLREHILFFILALIIVLATLSRGALISYALVFATYYFFLGWRSKLFIIICSLMAIGLIIFLSGAFIDNYLNVMLERANAEAGLGGGRLDIWYYFLENINYNFFWGHGYMLEHNGKLIQPHSDLIRIIQSYGLLSCIIFFLFLKGFCIRHLMLLFAFLIPFLINTVIDDYRLFGIFLTFYSLIRYSGSKSVLHSCILKKCFPGFKK